MMGLNPVEAVHYFGKKKRLFKVHFRNVTSPCRNSAKPSSMTAMSTCTP